MRCVITVSHNVSTRVNGVCTPNLVSEKMQYAGAKLQKYVHFAPRCRQDTAAGPGLMATGRAGGAGGQLVHAASKPMATDGSADTCCLQPEANWAARSLWASNIHSGHHF